jgi:glycosyltransferase involved in cell wall biosynthesis
MRIAVIGSKGLPPQQGGIEHHCAEVYSRLVKKGHLVDLFGRSSYTNLSWRDPSAYQGIRVISMPGLSVRGFDALTSTAMSAVMSSLLVYDIVHFHALGPSLWSWLPKLAGSAKVVVTCHGLDWQRSKWGKSSSSIIKLGEKAAVRFANHITVVSDDLQDYFANVYSQNTTCIGNAPADYSDCDDTFSYGKSLGLNPKKYILFLGRLVPEKCPDLLIKAFHTAQLNGWKLVVAGGVSDTSKFAHSLVRLAGNNPNIIFPGALRGAKLTEIVRNAGLFTLPSNLEGQPLALLEAMREGIPVLASDISVHKKILGSGTRGLLFSANNLDSCITQLQWATQNNLAMLNQAKLAQQYVSINHSWDQVAKDYLQIYKELQSISYQAHQMTTA